LIAKFTEAGKEKSVAVPAVLSDSPFRMVTMNPGFPDRTLF
jgi:hypothetical protein